MTCRVIVGLFLISLLSCSNNGAQDLLETAQFEERQHNQDHARELYEQIVSRYPNSDYAKTARARLEELSAER